jgi:hypothetical protein
MFFGQKKRIDITPYKAFMSIWKCAVIRRVVVQ